MFNKKLAALAVGLVASIAAAGPALAGINIVQTPTDYFVPTDAEKYDSPYYRGQSQDWGWTHGALADQDDTVGGVAFLRISAFDVDRAQGEVDNIYALDSTGQGSVLLGSLLGANDAWAFTDFVITDLTVLSQIKTGGLQLWMDIDVNNAGWIVTLAKSQLCSNTRELENCQGNANPGLPEPATMVLMGLGLLGLSATRRRKS